MQTSISNIPLNQSSSSSLSMDDDPDVASVIQEMSNMSSSQPQQKDNQQEQMQQQMFQQQMQQQQMQQQMLQQQMLQQQMQQQQKTQFQLPGQQLQSNKHNNLIDKYINKTIAQRALTAAFVAFILFYPFDLSPLYEKHAYLKLISPYERFVRALLLAILLYILFMKLNI